MDRIGGIHSRIYGHAVLSERAVKGSGFTLEDAKDDFSVYFKGETEVSENLTYKPDETYDSCLNKGFDMLAVALEHWQDDYVVKTVAEPFSIGVQVCISRSSVSSI